MTSKIRRSIFNYDLEEIKERQREKKEINETLDKESETILTSLSDLKILKESDPIEETIDENINESTRKISKYAVTTKVRKDREIRLVVYIIESDSKTQAGKLGRDRLIENGYKEEDIISSRVTKARSNASEEDTLFEMVKINYEVSFNIKINSERFRKTFIIKAGTPDEATNLMLVRCKKEFKGYRSITKVEVKEADENSKESSELIEEIKIKPAISNNDNLLKEEEEEKNVLDINMVEWLQKTYDEKMQKVADEFTDKENMNIVTTSMKVKNSKIGKCIKDRGYDFERPTFSRLEHKEKHLAKLNEMMNREMRRGVEITTQETTLKEAFISEAKRVSKKSIHDIRESFKEEHNGKTYDQVLNEKREENNEEEEINEAIKETEELMKSASEMIENNLLYLKEQMLDSIETNEKLFSKNNDNEKELKTTIVDSDNYGKLDIIADSNKRITRIKSKGSMLFANKPKEYECTINLSDGSKIKNSVIVEANSKEEVMSMLLTALSMNSDELFQEMSSVTIVSDEGIDTMDIINRVEGEKK